MGEWGGRVGGAGKEECRGMELKVLWIKNEFQRR